MGERERAKQGRSTRRVMHVYDEGPLLVRVVEERRAKLRGAATLEMQVLSADRKTVLHEERWRDVADAMVDHHGARQLWIGVGFCKATNAQAKP